MGSKTQLFRFFEKCCHLNFLDMILNESSCNFCVAVVKSPYIYLGKVLILIYRINRVCSGTLRILILVNFLLLKVIFILISMILEVEISKSFVSRVAKEIIFYSFLSTWLQPNFDSVLYSFLIIAF